MVDDNEYLYALKNDNEQIYDTQIHNFVQTEEKWWNQNVDPVA